MTAPIVITQVGTASLDLLAALHASSLEEPWSRRELALFLDQPGTFAMIASAGDTPTEAPLGLALCRATAEDSELIALGVVPSGRHRGAGRALVETALKRLAALGATKVFLEVAEDNASARRLYDSFGFVEVGLRKDYYQRPATANASALVLRLDIAPESVSSGET
jgi:ribosomal-protein-alanine N-acetyltransferase